MFHELLFALSGSTGDIFVFDGKDIKVNEDINLPLFHPSEKAVVNEILEIGTLYKSLKTFLELHQNISKHEDLLRTPTSASTSGGEDPTSNNENLNGVYVHGFCNGIDSILELYLTTLSNLELKIIEETYTSLNEFRAELNHFAPLFKVLLSLIKNLKNHGKSSSILVEIVKNEFDSNIHIQHHLKLLVPWMNKILYKHITNWVVFGILVDPLGEFFIQRIPANIAREDSTGTGGSFSSLKSDEQNSMRSVASTSSDQQYILDYSLVPSHLPHQLIDRIMFIGNSITILKDSERTKACITAKQNQFYEKMLKLPLDSFDISELNAAIEELSLSIGKDLHHLIVTETDLKKHLGIIKDFYLSGRGEVFHDFLNNLMEINLTKHSFLHDIRGAFQLSASRVHIQEDIIQGIGIKIDPKFQPTSQLDKVIPHLSIEIKHEWPLQILFTQDSIRKYNQIFQFLLKIRLAQLELSNIWRKTRKIFRFPIQKGPAELRNLMHFFINHLQHYFQEDVLENNFNILLNNIDKSENFDQVRVAHAEFQSNIINQLFLSNDKINHSLDKLLYICFSFVKYMKQHMKDCEVKNVPINEGYSIKISDAGTNFWRLIHLLKNYFKMESLNPKSGIYLSQFMLRLDFNTFFSDSIRYYVPTSEGSMSSIEFSGFNTETMTTFDKSSIR